MDSGDPFLGGASNFLDSDASRALDEEISINVVCDPVTATSQQKGIRVLRKMFGGTKVLHYKKKTVEAAEKMLYYLFAKYRPQRPFSGPIEVCLNIAFPKRACDLKAKHVVPHTTRPDLDNLSKMILDVLTKLGFWHDDSKVTSLYAHKCYSASPGYAVTVRRDPHYPL